MRRIALITCDALPNLSVDDALLLRPFQEQGYTPYPIKWDSKQVAWETFDALLIRSSWDYHYRVQEYEQWLHLLESLQLPVWNPIKVVRWNMRKTYLRELEQRGIEIVPTLLIEQGSTVNLAHLLEKNSWQEIVIKPTMGASAFQVEKIDRSPTDKLQELLETTDVMVQPFLREVQTEGEYSFIFLGGSYSHTILKCPRSGEFRVQPRYGGTWSLIYPSQEMLQQVTRVYEALPQPLLYARIDGLKIRHRFVVMEVEVHEPSLAFHAYPQAAEHLVHMLSSYLQEKTS
jgi:hypothetical protein